MKALFTRSATATLFTTQSANVKARKKRRKGTTRYCDYDADGATPLDFEEWYAMMPSRVRNSYPAATTRKWFDAAERTVPAAPSADHLSINDFFLWTLSDRATAYGTASLELAFAEYDKQPAYMGRGGLLDREEFAVVCKAMGFAPHAAAIFKSLDKDGSGEIGYEELTEAIETEGCSDISLESKRFLIALAWTSASSGCSNASEGGRPPALSNHSQTVRAYAAGWRIKGHDQPTAFALKDAEAELARLTEESLKTQRSNSATYKEIVAAKRAEAEAAQRAQRATLVHRDANTVKVRDELQGHVRQCQFMIADVVRLLLDDEAQHEPTMDIMQWHKAMKSSFRFIGTPWVLDDVFKCIDFDSDGEICFDELWEWCRGYRHPFDRRVDRRAQRARDLVIEPPAPHYAPGEPAPAGIPLERIQWDVPTFQRQLWGNLERARVSTTDLCRAWDKSGAVGAKPALDKAEFLKMVRGLFRHASGKTAQLEARAAPRAALVRRPLGLPPR